MSYLRYSSILRYVDSESWDYVYPSYDPETKEEIIVDYGGISDSGLVELICRCFFDDVYKSDELLKKHLVKRLADRLKVRLRKRPLTAADAFSLEMAKLSDLNKKEVKR